jgi:hypothetical protein
VSTVKYKRELIKEVEGLPSVKMKEILDFVYFLKAKDTIDPTQMYFWTKQWQDMEKEADSDKKKGNVIGDGSLKNLLEKLKK